MREMTAGQPYSPTQDAKQEALFCEKAGCSWSLQLPTLLYGHCLLFQDTLARTEVWLREA